MIGKERHTCRHAPSLKRQPLDTEEEGEGSVLRTAAVKSKLHKIERKVLKKR